MDDSIRTPVYKIPESSNPAVTALTDVMADRLFTETKEIMGKSVSFKELMMMYTCALKEVSTKFEVLNTEFNIRSSRNPITHIMTRLKRTSSLVEKMQRYKLPFTLDAIMNSINDVAGVRIICAYVDDIYLIADSFLRQDDITLIEKKDYIKNPKPSGYRSLHLIVNVPVFFSDFKKDMRVEVQIRTIAMDFWATLEHQLRYKQDVPNAEDIIRQLYDCAEIITDVDEKMLNIRRQIETISSMPSDDEILLDRLSRLEMENNY